MIFVCLCTQTDFGGIFKIIQIYERTECELKNAELSLSLFYIQSKEIGNKKYYEENKENLKNESKKKKARKEIFRLNITVGKDKEVFWLNRLNAKKTAFV